MTLQDVTWSYRRGELMLQTPEYSSLLVLSIPLTLLDDQVDELPRSVCSVRDDVLANRIRQQINATIQGGMEHPLQLAGRQARHQFQSEIKELVFSFFDVAHQQNQNIKQSLQKAQRVVAKAQEAFIESAETPLTVDELCSLTHTSRRTLQNCFHEVLGVCPITYLKAIRLNAVRRTLKKTTNTMTIQDVACNYGFWHMSQFAADYRRLFGEKPSETRLLYL